MKHLLKLLDLSKEEITELLDLADRLKAETKAGVEHHILKGKTLGMIFEKSSTRTRVSFETGMYVGRLMLSLRNAFQPAPVDLRKICGVIESERNDCRRKPVSGQRQLK